MGLKFEDAIFQLFTIYHTVRTYRTSLPHQVKQKIKIFLGFPNMTVVGAQTQGDQVSLITGPTNFLNGVMVRIVNLVLCGDIRKAKVGHLFDHAT